MALRLPAWLLSVTAAGFLTWAILLLASPGGSTALEWTQLVVASLMLGVGLVAVREPTDRRARRIRWILLAFAVFGAVTVLGLAADDDSSRTWARLGWAALVTGSVTSLVAWWTAQITSRARVVAGGVVAAVLIAGGAGITLNCDPTLQRSWCDPLFEAEQALVERVEVEGELQRKGRAGGAGGAALMAYLVEGGSIEQNTFPPPGFAYEARPIQSIEIERGRYTALDGPDSRCRIDVKLEQIPAGLVETVMVSCR